MFKNLIIKVQAFLALRAKVSEARSKFKADGIRRFIIPFRDGTMDVLTKQQALTLKIQGHLAKDFTAKTIYGACFFFTDTNAPHEKVQSEMPEREFRRRKVYYYKWFKMHH